MWGDLRIGGLGWKQGERGAAVVSKTKRGCGSRSGPGGGRGDWVHGCYLTASKAQKDAVCPPSSHELLPRH